VRRSRALRGVPGVVAAAEGRRLAGPKALLRLGARSFLEACLQALDRPGVDGRVVVVGHRAEEVQALVPAGGAVRVVTNARYHEGMLTSVHAGLGAAEALGADVL